MENIDRLIQLGYLFPDNYYVLNISLTSDVPKSIVKKYKSMMLENNKLFE